MSDLRELYQQLILDHNKSPRNFRELHDASHAAEGYNPLCGDHLHLYVKLENDRVEDISFQGTGCAISKASASMMTSLVKGKTLEEAKALFQEFHGMVTGCLDAPVDEDHLGKLMVFSGVGEYPARVKCATLAWHTLQAALAENERPVSTE